MSPIDAVREQLDIVELIGESVQLRKMGRAYQGFCPFHSNTRTPAFTVYPDTQSFYCFGCQASGTIFDFVMRKQGLDFREALQQLADRAGIKLAPPSAEEEQRDQQRTRLLQITSAAAFYFNYILLHLERGQPARDYLAARDIAPASWETFQLGYSLNEWGHLLAYLTEKKGFEPHEVAAAGLASEREQGGYYDRFRARLIFPIRNTRGEVIGFGGRALGDVQPKYLNTPQTLLFDKSSVLYGLDQAREPIRSSDAAVLVEGYVDVITAHQHGFRNVVAPLGTALNAGHIGMLKKLTQNIYLALDADAAGQRATLRGLQAVDEAGSADEAQAVVSGHGLVHWERDVTLRIIKLPPGRDPDDVIKREPQRWQALIDTALPVMDFYIEAYTADLDLAQPQQQRTALDRLLPLVRQLDETGQRVYVARLEQFVGLRAELILDLLRRNERPTSTQRRTRERSQPPAPAQTQAAPASEPRAQSALARREDYLLQLLLHYPQALPTAEELLAADMQAFPDVRDLLGVHMEQVLSQTANRLIFQAWQQAAMPPCSPPPDAAAAAESADTLPADTLPADTLPDWSSSLDSALHPQLARLTSNPLLQQHSYRYLQEVEQCVRNLRLEQVRFWQRRLGQQLQASDTSDQDTPSGERADAQSNEHADTLALIAALQRYQHHITTPRRTRTYTDLRDLLRRD